MCLAVPAEIKSIEGSTATVDYGGVKRTANISLVEAKVGDFVIVHAGYAIQVMDREEAEKTLDIFREMLEQAGFPEPPALDWYFPGRPKPLHPGGELPAARPILSGGISSSAQVRDFYWSWLNPVYLDSDPAGRSHH